MTSAAARKPRERAKPAKSRTGLPQKGATSPVVNIAVAKAHLPELVERAARGEIIVLARAGKPMARLVPLDDERKALRVPGKGKGRFRMTADFDDPLPDDVLASFEGRGT
jgi:prevent-host-death family protein